MKKQLVFLSLIISFLVSLAIAGQAGSAAPVDTDRVAAIDEQGRYQRMSNNFFIIYDPSYNMDTPYKNTGYTRMEAEKKILRQSNDSLPELGWQSGLYPHWKGGLWLHGATMAFEPYYELKRYDKKAYGKAIEQLPVRPTGPPMLQRGLMKLDLLLGLPGRTEVFIFSDGNHSTYKGLETEPLEQARMLAAKYDVCFTIVSSATTEEEKRLLDDIASVNTCSQVMDFDTVYAKPEHLFGKLYMDKAQVGFNNILFDFDKYDIKAKYKPALDKLGRYLTENPEAYVVLSGFCDSIGSEAYNIKLSKKRAEAVRSYLRSRFKIADDRLLTYWYGYANPVASNKTAAGRALNRRVTIGIRHEK